MQLSLVIRDALLDGAGITAAEAERLAQHIIEHGVRFGLAGDTYYWPNRYVGMSTSERAAAIVEAFDGTNLEETCARFRVSKSTVYRYVKEHRTRSCNKPVPKDE